MHDEVMEQCDVHLLYLGRGLYVELAKCATQLEIINNPDPNIKSTVVGKLTTVGARAYEDVLFAGLGTGINKSMVLNQPHIKDLDSTENCEPLDLSVSVDEKDLVQDTGNKAQLLVLRMEPVPSTSKSKEFSVPDAEHATLTKLDMNSTPSTNEYSEWCVLDIKSKIAVKPDKALSPSPPPIHMAKPIKKDTSLKKEVRIQLNKLDLRTDQSIKLTKEILS